MITIFRSAALLPLLPLSAVLSAPVANDAWGTGSGTPALSVPAAGAGNLDWGDGTPGDADDSMIHATFAGVTLNPGQSLTLEGTFTCRGIAANPPNADAFRIGIFDSAGSADNHGWLGYWAGIDTPATAGGTLRKRNHPNNGLFASSAGADTILATYNGATGYLRNDTDYHFAFTISNSDGRLAVASSIGQGGTLLAAHAATDTAPATRAFNRIGLLAGNILDADQIRLRGVTLNSDADPYSTGTVADPADPYPEPVYDPVAGTPNLDSSKPNVLFLISDDQSYPHASAYLGASGQGSGYDPPGTAGDIFTPGFDRIAREGLLFNRAIMPSPGCSPTRAAILCGAQIWQIREAGTHDSLFPGDLVTYPDLFSQAGYQVGHVGKGWGPGSFKGQRDVSPAGPDVASPSLVPPADGISSEDYAGGFRRFLANRPPGSPFCFWLGANEPHRGYEKDSGTDNPLHEFDPAHVQVPGYLPDTPAVRGDIADYLLEVKWFDRHVQRAILSLTAEELDNTIVIVCSDNGMPFPSGKANIRPGGVRSPLAIRWPNGIKNPGRVIKNWVSLIDIAPSILKAAGIGVPEQMSGKDLDPIFRSSEGGEVPGFDRAGMLAGRERHTNARPLNAGYPGRVLFRDRYCLIWNIKADRWPTGDPPGGVIHHPGYWDTDGSPSRTLLFNTRNANDTASTDARGRTLMSYFDLMTEKRPSHEFYDLAADPDGLHNLIGDPAHAATIASMKDEMRIRLLADQDPRVLGFGDLIDSYPRFSSGHADDFTAGKTYNEWAAPAFQSLSTLTSHSPAGILTRLDDAGTGLTLSATLAGDRESKELHWIAGGGSAGARVTGAKATFTKPGWASILAAADTRGTWGYRSSLIEIAPATASPRIYTQPAGAREIAIEAENFSRKHDSATHRWTAGSATLAATPDIGTNHGNPGFLTEAPRADYFIHFAKPGYYQLWVLGAGGDAGSDSCHFALDGMLAESLDNAKLTRSGTPAWSKTAGEGNTLGVWVRAPGMHVLNLYMAADGAVIDKMILSLDFEYNPATDPIPVTPTASATVPQSPRITLDPALSTVGRDAYFSLNASVSNGSPEPWTTVGAAGGHHLADASAPASPLALFDPGSYIFRLGAVNSSARIFKDQVITASSGFSPIEDFRNTWFGSSANIGDAADESDADRDGIPNLLEFLMMTDPLDPGSPGSAIGATGAGDFLLKLRTGGLGDPAGSYLVDGYQVRLLWSDDLLDFVADPARFSLAPGPPASPGLDSWRVSFADNALPREFMRLEADRR